MSVPWFTFMHRSEATVYIHRIFPKKKWRPTVYRYLVHILHSQKIGSPYQAYFKSASHWYNYCKKVKLSSALELVRPCPFSSKINQILVQNSDNSFGEVVLERCSKGIKPVRPYFYPQKPDKCPVKVIVKLYSKLCNLEPMYTCIRKP